jgi:hypothetical protein
VINLRARTAADQEVAERDVQVPQGSKSIGGGNFIAVNGCACYRLVMIYQHPLGYLLGLEGVALLRTFAGDFDRDFGDARIAEIRKLLDSPELSNEGVVADRVTTVDGYRIWSATYDQPGNGIFAYEEPFVHEIIDPLAPGAAVDAAACDTGRHAEYLTARGHQVIGADSSPEMLTPARARTPGGLPPRRPAPPTAA